MATVKTKSGEQRLVLYGVSWREYVGMLHAFSERRGVRLTYDRGTLEFMTLSLEHERWRRYFNLLIQALTMEMGFPLFGGGSTTFRRRRKQRGLEPDECYWIASEPLMRGKTTFDLRRDPAPDLVVEVEVSRSVLSR